MLYDDIVTYGFGMPEDCAEKAEIILELLRQAVVIKVDNVGSYYRNQHKEGHEWSWVRGDFPNCAPPWQTFFMEFDPSGSGKRDAVLFDCLDVESLESEGMTLFGPEGAPLDGAKWLFRAFPFIRLANQDQDRRFVPTCIYFAVDKEGRRIPVEAKGGAFFAESFEWDTSTDEGLTDFRFCLLNYEQWLIFPCLLALSFLHCKNVIRTLNEPRLNRAARRRGDRPLVRFYTLSIEPMKEILQREGDIEKQGIQRALHICRGHFKDYTKTGLFGKRKGLYWWDAHVRGTLSHGMIIKDYALGPNNG